MSDIFDFEAVVGPKSAIIFLEYYFFSSELIFDFMFSFIKPSS